MYPQTQQALAYWTWALGHWGYALSITKNNEYIDNEFYVNDAGNQIIYLMKALKQKRMGDLF